MLERKPGITGVEVHHDLGVDQNYKAYMTGHPIKMGPPEMAGGKEAPGGPYVPMVGSFDDIP